jgi:hypothetical protein
LVTPWRWVGLGQVINVVTLYNIYNSIGVFSLFLLIYFFVLRVSGSRYLALCTAAFIIGGYSIVYNKRLFYDDFNIYGRATFPYLSSLAFFIYIHVLWKALQTSKKVYLGTASIIFGILFYIYFFTWSFAAAFTALLGFFYFISGKRVEAKRVALVFIIGLTIGSYNLFRLYRHVNSEWGEQFAYFQSSSYGHSPVLSKIGLVAGVLLFFYWRKYKNSPLLPLLFAFVSAGWVALNQQIITGRILQYGHYYWYFIVPLGILVLFYLLWELLALERYGRWAAGICLCVVILNTVVGQYRSFQAALPNKLYEQRFAPLIAELKKYPTGVILAGDDPNSNLFTIYTNHDLLYANLDLIGQIPMSRWRDSLYIYLFLNKNSRSDIRNYLYAIMNDAGENSMYKQLYKAIEGYASGYDLYTYRDRAVYDKTMIAATREKIITLLDREYEPYKNNPTKMIALLRSYNVTYIVWDANQYPEWDLSFLEGALINMGVYENVHLYQLR